MDVNNIFIPMIILTNYDKYKKILKEYDKILQNVRNQQEKTEIINQYRKELEIWHRNVMVVSLVILILSCILLFLANIFFKLTYNDWVISVLILVYILCFIIEKYRNKESIMEEIQKYASQKGFVSLDQIMIF